MALKIKHLNADSTFLLTFGSDLPRGSSDARDEDRVPGVCTVLIDPWLVGTSSILNPRFQLSKLIRSPCILSLADLPLPDLLIVSQGKPDHCHKETLCTLPRDAPITILAAPDAYKQIKSWKHFTHAKLIRLEPYLAGKDTVFRLTVPLALSATGESRIPGELTVSYLEQAADLTGLHNGIGITYRPSGALPSSSAGTGVATPPLTPSILPFHLDLPSAAPPSVSEPITPSDSLHDSRSISTASRSQNVPSGGAERPISIFYTPHGISPPTVDAYATSFLAPLGAVPPTVLFHAINTEENPWYLGGKVVSGLPGGIGLIERFGARYWISAHDEAKQNSGLATKLIKSRTFGVAEAQARLDLAVGVGRATTRILELDVGESFII